MSDDLRGLTWKQLRALAATVETGSVTGASKSLYVTPPAITIQLKQLEAQIGAPIFEPHGLAIRRDRCRRRVAHLARDLDRLVARTAERVAALRSGATGSIVFGVVSTGKYIAPAMVANIHRRASRGAGQARRRQSRRDHPRAGKERIRSPADGPAAGAYRGRKHGAGRSPAHHDRAAPPSPGSLSRISRRKTFSASASWRANQARARAI